MPHVTANGIELYYEDFGVPADPAILLIMGLGVQGIAWPDPFVARLVDAGFRVIRFDNRDIGRSTHLHGARAVSAVRAMISAQFGWSFPVAYTLRDMATDAVGLLDALGVDRAHVVGASMGGMIAQLLASEWPDRVASLTSVMSSSGAPGLPGPTPAVRKLLIRKPIPNMTRDQAIAMGIEVQDAISYPDPARTRESVVDLVGRSYDAGFNPLGTRRQLLAIVHDGNRTARLATIATSTLIIHGAVDPLIPFAHAEDLATRIPGARLERVEEMGHDLPPSRVAHLADLIATHARANAALSRSTVAA